jgi:hypothetical protein
MNIRAAITRLRAAPCACKHIDQAVEKLSRLATLGIRKAEVIFGSHTVILKTGEGQEILCSRFLEQRA